MHWEGEELAEAAEAAEGVEKAPTLDASYGDQYPIWLRQQARRILLLHHHVEIDVWERVVVVELVVVELAAVERVRPWF